MTTPATTEPGFFIDPLTGEVYDDAPGCGCDPTGSDLIGSDEDALWWGTDRAAWLLSEEDTIVRVSGRCRASAKDFHATFIGTPEEATRYAERWGTIDLVEVETIQDAIDRHGPVDYPEPDLKNPKVAAILAKVDEWYAQRCKKTP
jgi:hypothetical protein